MLSEDVGDVAASRSIEVTSKPLQCEIDVGNLLLSDPNEVNVSSLRSNPEKYLKSLTRDGVQLVINAVWQLPFERVDDVVVTKLPAATFILPREKPAPKPRPPTKWETYAKEKGLTKRKKAKLVWDDMVKKWVPRYGYKRAEVETEKDWLLEVPGGADPMEDQFEKRAETKAEKVSKNELQRLRNLARSKNIEVPKAGLTSKEKPTKNELSEAMVVAKKATASLGKFQPKVKGAKEGKVKGGTGRKRLFQPLVQASGIEKKSNLDVLEKVLSKKPKLNLEKALSNITPSSVGRNSDADGESRGSFRAKGGRGGSGGKKRNDGKRRTGGGVSEKRKRLGGGSAKSAFAAQRPSTGGGRGGGNGGRGGSRGGAGGRGGKRR